MTENESAYDERCRAIHLLRNQEPVSRVAELLNLSESWVYKWRMRFDQEGWPGLQSRPRRPHHHPTQLSDSVYESMRHARLLRKTAFKSQTKEVQ